SEMYILSLFIAYNAPRAKHGAIKNTSALSLFIKINLFHPNTGSAIIDKHMMLGIILPLL
ncbi:TPA: hypothetical protein ACHJFJ_005137, partial [Escherichia coli]